MDEIDAINAYENYEIFRQNPRILIRRDFYEELTDLQFIKNLRFNKAGVERLTDLLEESLGDEPAHGMSRDNQVNLYT